MTVNIANSTSTAVAATMAAAMREGTPEEQTAAWQMFNDEIAQRLMADFEELKQSNDSNILQARGYRQLTSDERKFYNRLIDAMKSANPKQTFADIIGNDADLDIMPETIIEDVYRNLAQDHQLLQRVNFQYVKYATKWILNDHTQQKAIWGTITDEIAQEIKSGFKVVDVNQSKLSAFAFVEKGMLDLGPTFLDAYIRAVLTEALLCGLEAGIVKGNGVNAPIGINRDIHDGVSFNTSTGYPAKEAIKVTSFAPAPYGALLARIAKTEKGHQRKFSQVQLICNMTDYLTKIMPASTVLTAQGTYVGNLFPFPTEVIISNELSDGEAAVGLLDEYSMFIGGDKNGTIEFSDEFKFVEDLRYFKIKQYGTGRSFDNTSFVMLDISELEPTYTTVYALTDDGIPTA